MRQGTPDYNLRQVTQNQAKIPAKCRTNKTPLLRKTLRNLHGLITFSACTVNTIICFAPILVFAVFKFAVFKFAFPIKRFRNLMTRWIMSVGEAWIGFNALIFAVSNSTR
jgi:hypothetical protein